MSTLVRRHGEGEYILVLIIQEWLQRIVTEIRIDGDSVDFKIIEECLCVVPCAVADVAPLAVSDNIDIIGNPRQSFSEGRPAFFSECLVEGCVEFIRADRVLGRLDYPRVKLKNRIVILEKELREPFDR